LPRREGDSSLLQNQHDPQSRYAEVCREAIPRFFKTNTIPKADMQACVEKAIHRFSQTNAIPNADMQACVAKAIHRFSQNPRDPQSRYANV
jgi:hypothetical protein